MTFIVPVVSSFQLHLLPGMIGIARKIDSVFGAGQHGHCSNPKYTGSQGICCLKNGDDASGNSEVLWWVRMRTQVGRDQKYVGEVVSSYQHLDMFTHDSYGDVEPLILDGSRRFACSDVKNRCLPSETTLMLKCILFIAAALLLFVSQLPFPLPPSLSFPCNHQSHSIRSYFPNT